MKRDQRVVRNFNAFLKHTNGKCPIIAYCIPIVPIVKCLIKNRLASGVGYYNGHDGKEIGAGFWENAKEGPKKGKPLHGPGGVRYQRYPDWEEVEPPGKPEPMDAPVKYVGSLPEESISLIKDAGLFFYSFLYYDVKGNVPDFCDVFGEKFITGLIVEADHHVYTRVAEALKKNPNANRDEALREAKKYIRGEYEKNYPYGLSGSGLRWYQGAAITRQKRWDHEIANRNFQVALAFLRGISRQYGMPFITYVAPMTSTIDGIWGNKVDPETPFAKFFNCTYASGGKPDSVLERQWYQAWFGGSAAVILESTSFYLFKKGPSEQEFEPGCMAAAAKRLNKLAFESDFDRGVPYRPGCILLDERHGWDMPSAPDGHQENVPIITARKIWGLFDYKHEDIMVDNFFGAVFPDYEYGSEWGGRRGNLVQTPYGESFDVLMSNASEKALLQYPAVFMLGKPKMTAGFRKRLEEYVKNGGNLVVNICQVPYEWADFLGVRFDPKYNRWYSGLGTLRASDWSEWLDPRRVWKEHRYHYSRVRAKKADVLAVTEQGDPLVLRHRVGKGTVWFVTAHYMQEISGMQRPNGLLQIAKFLIGHVLEPYQKIRVQGRHLSYMVNETNNGLRIMLMNNSQKDWLGWISVPGLKGGKKRLTEVYAGERLHSYSSPSGLSIRLSIPSGSLRILAVE